MYNFGHLDFSDVAVRFLPQEMIEALELQKGDLLLERSGGGPDQPVGRVGFVENDLPGFAFSNFIHLLRPDPKKIEPLYLGWVLYQINRSGAVLRLEQQTTQMRNLHFRDYLTIRLPKAPIEEQKEIARILEAVDRAIECTRTAIAKAQRLKRGLMQKLLPPWIGFKKLHLDLNPSIKEVLPAGNVARIVNGSTPSREELSYWRNGTIPWLATGKVNERIIEKADEFVTPKALQECSIEILPAGSILVAMIGQGKTRGMTAYLNQEACINQNFGAFIPGPKVVGKWLFHYLDFYYTFLREIGGGTNQGALNCYLLKRIRIPLPQKEKQLDVIKQLDACDSVIAGLDKTVNQLIRLKYGLMQDLLTGKVRVRNVENLNPASDLNVAIF